MTADRAVRTVDRMLAAPELLPPPTPLPPPLGARPARRRRPLRWLVLAAVAAIGIWIQNDAMLVVPILFVLVVPFEKLFPRHRQRLRRPGLGTDLAYAVSEPVLAAVTLAFAAVIGMISLAWLPGLAVRPLVDAAAGGRPRHRSASCCSTS